MTKEQIVSLISDKPMYWLGILWALSVLAIIISPFLWLWTDLPAGKIALTGFLCAVILMLVHQFLKRVFNSVADEFLAENKHVLKESKFKQKLEELQAKRNEL